MSRRSPDQGSGLAALLRSGRGADQISGESSWWTSSATIAALSWLWLLAVTVADSLTSPQVVVLTVFLALSPLLAASVLAPAITVRFAAAAVVLAAISGWWDRGQGAQYWVRLVDVAAVGVLAVLVSVIRTRRQADLQTSQRIATTAQEALLPVLPRQIGALALATRYHSATQAAQVGGDFFDFVTDRGRTRLILGDVSGKGVDAVTQAARVIRAFRQYAASEPDLLGASRRIDEYVLPFWDWDYYATAVLIEIRDDDTMTVVSAGHPPPLHLSQAGVRELPVQPCLPLGLGPADGSTEHSWRPADRMLLYTDGLIEARDPSGAFLPRAVIDRALQQLTDLDSTLDALLDAVHQHAGRFGDDLALLLIANTGPPPEKKRLF
jgi:sigma-B regulation protein RsbU (phosphoserine phosphatase)